MELPQIQSWKLEVLKGVSSDLSYAVWQYQLHGYVTNSMIIVNILHAFYVVDFFVNEDWSEFPHSTEY